MKILFKSDEILFYIEDDILDALYLNNIYTYLYKLKIDISKIPNIETQPILYHIHKGNSIKFPVYYEYKNRAIIKYINDGDIFSIITLEDKDKDYTQVNINKILNENII